MNTTEIQGREETCVRVTLKIQNIKRNELISKTTTHRTHKFRKLRPRDGLYKIKQSVLHVVTLKTPPLPPDKTLIFLYIHSRAVHQEVIGFSYVERQTFLTPLLLRVTSEDGSSLRCLPRWQLTLFLQRATVTSRDRSSTLEPDPGDALMFSSSPTKGRHCLLSDKEVSAGQRLTHSGTQTTHRTLWSNGFC